MKDFLVYLAFVSVAAIVICFYDKFASRRKMWRVPENALMALGALGGALLMYITMRIIKHKTRHNKFMVGLPVVILAQIALVFVFYNKIL